MDKGEVLKAACDDVVAALDLRPEYDAEGNLGKTYCNLAARRVARAMGCLELDPPELLADAMYALMALNKSGCWKRATGSEAAIHALGGGLAFACSTSGMLKQGHGHIAAIRPESMQRSGSLDRDVPMVANVGPGDPGEPLVEVHGGKRTRPNWNCKASQAFPVSKGEPSYFLWKEVA